MRQAVAGEGHLEAKCNYVVNNLLMKMIVYADKQKLLVSAAELIYTVDKLVST